MALDKIAVVTGVVNLNIPVTKKTQEGHKVEGISTTLSAWPPLSRQDTFQILNKNK